MPSKKDLVLWDTRQKRLQGSLLLDVKTEWDRRASLNVPLVQLFCTKRGICLFYDIYIQPAKKTLLWHITYMSLLWQIGLWCSTITFPIRKLTLFLPLSLSGLHCCQGSMLIWFSNFQLFSNKSDPKDSHWIDRTRKIAEKTWTLFSTICYNNINITIHRRQFILDVFGKRFAKGLPLKACGLKLSFEAWILKVLNWTIQ